MRFGLSLLICRVCQCVLCLGAEELEATEVKLGGVPSVLPDESIEMVQEPVKSDPYQSDGHVSLRNQDSHISAMDGVYLV